MLFFWLRLLVSDGWTHAEKRNGSNTRSPSCRHKTNPPVSDRSSNTTLKWCPAFWSRIGSSSHTSPSVVSSTMTPILQDRQEVVYKIQLPFHRNDSHPGTCIHKNLRKAVLLLRINGFILPQQFLSQTVVSIPSIRLSLSFLPPLLRALSGKHAKQIDGSEKGTNGNDWPWWQNRGIPRSYENDGFVCGCEGLGAHQEMHDLRDMSPFNGICIR